MSNRFTKVNILFRAKVFGDWNTVKIFTYLTVVYWSHVEEENQTNEDDDAGNETDPEKYQLSSSLIDAEGDEGHDGIADEKSEDEPEQMSVVINPGQETREEEDSSHSHQLQYRHLWILETGPLMNHLHDAGGQETKVSSSRSNLSSVGNKDGAGEVPHHP